MVRPDSMYLGCIILTFYSIAHWYTDVENLPHRVGKVIDGLTPNSRNFHVGFRFMRFRFPYVKFEWFLQTSYCEIYTKMDLESTKFQPAEVEVLWKAWARAGAASGTYYSILSLLCSS